MDALRKSRIYVGARCDLRFGEMFSVEREVKGFRKDGILRRLSGILIHIFNSKEAALQRCLEIK